ncbi:MAG: anti-sigma regulatory factor (Ser/Thr protein kinase) [Desulforhopalus sp.]|jgi:anti-sigma regulatory factor (Ser/Thr protein kinase)
MTPALSPILLAQITLPVQKIMVNTAVQCTHQIAKILAFTETEAIQLELAIEEVFCNAVEHFSGPVEGEQILLEFSIENDLLIISIRENGIPFDLKSVKQYTPSNLDDISRPGLGMLLMKQGVDTIDFFVHGRDGKETRLTKKISLNNIPKELQIVGKERTRKKRFNVPKPELRAPKLSELSEICRLAWRCYGYTQEELLYDLDQLKEKTLSGELQSIVAFDPESGNMIGHAGLKLHDPASKVPELGLAFVDSTYRCPDLSHRLGRSLMDIAERHGDDGVFDCSVTTHTFSQKAMQKTCGSKACCLLMGIAAAGLQAKELITSKQDKGSVISHYYAFNRSKHTIFCPSHHQKMVAEIYNWLELPREFGASDSNAAQGESSVSVFPSPDELNVAFIIVNKIGTTTLEKVTRELQQCRHDNKDAVYAFIPFGVPASPILVEQCEQIGFSFAGIMPHIHEGDDRIIMQCICTPINTEAIRLYGEESRKLFSYILKDQQRLAEMNALIA